VSGIVFDALALDGRDIRALPSNGGKSCSPCCCRRGRRQRATTCSSTAASSLTRPPSSASRASGEEAREPVRAGVAGLAQAQVPAPSGVRHRRLHRASGSRAHFGALHWASTRAGGCVRLEGRHGLRHATLATSRRSSTAPAGHLPFDVGTPAGRGHHWVEPRLVCECASRSGPRTAASAIRPFSAARRQAPEECPRDPVTDSTLPERGGPLDTLVR